MDHLSEYTEMTEVRGAGLDRARAVAACVRPATPCEGQIVRLDAASSEAVAAAIEEHGVDGATEIFRFPYGPKGTGYEAKRKAEGEPAPMET